MAISTLCLFLGLVVLLDMYMTFKLYKSSEQDNLETKRYVKSSIEAIRHEVASYRLSIDGKIERAIPKAKRVRRKLKDESSDKNNGKEKKSSGGSETKK